MKFDVKYTRISNKLFFISNLTEWHFSVNPEYNKAWLKITGPLNPKEKKILKEIIPILKKHEFEYEDPKKYIGTYFINLDEKNIWKNISKLLNKNHFDTLKNAFNIFEQKFNLIWKNDQKFLKDLSKQIEKKLENNEFKKILKKIEILFNQEIKKYTIHLLATPRDKRFMGGGANTGNWHYTLELGDTQNIVDGILILFHEIAHQFIRNLS